MLFGKRGKSGLVALNLDLAQVAAFVKERLGVEVKKIIIDFAISILVLICYQLIWIFFLFPG